MHPDLESRAHLDGFITRPQVLDCGLDDQAIAEMKRAGVLESIGAGLYAPAEQHRRLTEVQRHVVKCRAVATRFADAVVFTHQSAAALNGLALWGIDLDHVHVTRRDNGRGRHQAGVHHHVGALMDDEFVEPESGLLVATPARATWEIAVCEEMEAALVTADSALHQRKTSDDELVGLARRYSTWRGSRHGKAVLSLSDGRSESPGETRCRLAFRRFDIPPPEPQYEVRDEFGQVVGRADWGWEEWRHLAEFDGLLKYRAPEADPTEISNIVTREKKREDRMRHLGWGMTRIVWADLDARQVRWMMLELRRAMDRSQQLYATRAS